MGLFLISCELKNFVRSYFLSKSRLISSSLSKSMLSLSSQRYASSSTSLSLKSGESNSNLCRSMGVLDSVIFCSSSGSSTDSKEGYLALIRRIYEVSGSFCPPDIGVEHCCVLFANCFIYF